jgi:superfamily I DNA and/or RNA helicase
MRGVRDGGAYVADAGFWAQGLFIVSPHHAHINATRRALTERRRWSHRPFVGTVDKMQGQDCDAVIASHAVADVEYALSEQEFIYSPNRLDVSITRGRANTVVFLYGALTEPSIQAFGDDRNAEGIAFMQGLVRFAEKRGEESSIPIADGVTLRLLRVRADTDDRLGQ